MIPVMLAAKPSADLVALGPAVAGAHVLDDLAVVVGKVVGRSRPQFQEEFCAGHYFPALIGRGDSR
jgi:hypothetical protein